MSSVYKRNLRFLEKYAPVLYNEIKNGEPIIEHKLQDIENDFFRINTNGKVCWINSIYSQDNEMENTFKYKDENIEVLIIIGLGNGRILSEVKKRFKHIKMLFIVEPYLEIFRSFINRQELGDVFSGLGNITFIVNQKEEESARLLVEILSESKFTDVEVVSQISYNLFNGKYISDFNERLLRDYRSRIVQIATLDKTKYTWIKNTISNFKSNFEYEQEIASGIANKIAIIVGAGPSLNKNIELLKEVQGKAIIVAASSAIKILESKGIKADIRFVIDAYEDENIYDQTFYDTSEEIPLLFAGQAYREVVLKYKGPKYFMLLPTDSFGAYILEKNNVPLHYISSGASVVQSVFSFLAESGCNKIVMIGQDMCLYDDNLYAEGVKSVNRDFFHEQGLIPFKDIYGKEVISPRGYLQIKYDYEAQIQRHPHVTVLNATEGGLGIEGVPNVTLREVIDNELQNESKHELSRLFKSIKRNDKKQLIKAFEVALTEVKEILAVNKKRLDFLIELNEEVGQIKEQDLVKKYIKFEEVYFTNLDSNRFYSRVVKENLAAQIIALKKYYSQGNTNNQVLRVTTGIKYYLGLSTEIEIFTEVCKDWIEEYLEEMKAPEENTYE